MWIQLYACFGISSCSTPCTGFDATHCIFLKYENADERQIRRSFTVDAVNFSAVLSRNHITFAETRTRRC